MDTIAEILKLLFVGLIAGIFSAYLSTWRHRNEKWWELRAKAYTELIEALSDLNHYYERNYKAMVKHRELSDEYKEELDKFWDSGYHNVRKLTATGSFLFSDDVNKALKIFSELKNDDHDGDYYFYLDKYYYGTTRCLETVSASSKHDLKVGGKWL
ncbi:MAG: hypothetical protein OEY89_17495 [Gammaproteobacteria bacterium]|nr:hypothetical protein [Gammaproteobacteria bacterium]